jgi:hypothetical protein
MPGDDTRFLTGTDEHSINIAQAAVDEGRRRREFVDEKVALFKTAEDGLGDHARPVHPHAPTRTTSGAARRWSAARTGRATSTSGRTRAGTCPNEGFRNATTSRDGSRHDLPEPHPEVPLQWLTEATGSSASRPTRNASSATSRTIPEFVQPDFRRNEMLGSSEAGSRTSRSAGTDAR